MNEEAYWKSQREELLTQRLPLEYAGTISEMVIELPENLQTIGWYAKMFTRSVIGPNHIIELKDKDENILIKVEGDTRFDAQKTFIHSLLEYLANIAFEQK